MFFNNFTKANNIILARVQCISDEHDIYAKQIYGSRVGGACSSSMIWNAPAMGVVKLNCDASLAGEGWVGLGVVARNHRARFCSAPQEEFAQIARLKLLKACKTLSMAICLAKRFECKDLILESDSQVIISRLFKAYFSDLDFVLEDILMFTSYFDYLLLPHVKRDGNIVAHHLAKLVLFGVEQIWENHCPAKVSPYVLMDTLSMDELMRMIITFTSYLISIEV